MHGRVVGTKAVDPIERGMRLRPKTPHLEGPPHEPSDRPRSRPRNRTNRTRLRATNGLMAPLRAPGLVHGPNARPGAVGGFHEPPSSAQAPHPFPLPTAIRLARMLVRSHVRATRKPSTRGAQGVYTGSSPDVHRKVHCTSGVPPVYTPCTWREATEHSHQCPRSANHIPDQVGSGRPRAGRRAGSWARCAARVRGGSMNRRIVRGLVIVIKRCERGRGRCMPRCAFDIGGRGYP